MPDPDASHSVYLPLVGQGSDEGELVEARKKRTRTPTPTQTGAPTATPPPGPTATPPPGPTATPPPGPTATPPPGPTATPPPGPTATPPPGPTATPPQLSRAPAIYIDLNRCIGCDACSLACKQENNVELGGLWNRVYGAEKGTFPSVGVRVMPLLCHHCGNAPCKAKCDSLGHRAIVQRPDGIVYIDAARCVGCQQCLPVCRYKAIFFNANTAKAEKCHLCMHRLDAGLVPACVVTCLAVTREFGDYDALRARHPNAKTMGGRVRILYDNLGDEPEHDGSTAGYPSPVECHH